MAKLGPRGLGHHHPRGGGNEIVLCKVFFAVCHIRFFVSITPTNPKAKFLIECKYFYCVRPVFKKQKTKLIYCFL